MLSVEAAQKRILQDIHPLPVEQVPLGACLGRVLAEEAVAVRAQPPADNSAMDGYAVRSADLAMLASQGRAEVPCRRRPIVAIISTGDEVHEPGEVLPPGHIWAGNAYGLLGLIQQVGATPRNLGIAAYTPEALRAIFASAEGADVVLSIGGVSVGDYDFVRQVLKEMGSIETFWKVAMRPGKPNACGTLSGAPYFGLPGNPVSCMVSFLQYVRPALLRMMGANELFLPTLEATLDETVRSKPGFLLLNRGKLRFDVATGRHHVTLTGAQGSGMVRSLSLADCLVVLPEDVDVVPEGATVKVQLLPGTGDLQAEPGLRVGS